MAQQEQGQSTKRSARWGKHDGGKPECARAEVRRAGRRAVAKLNTAPRGGEVVEFDDLAMPQVTRWQRFSRRAAALALALVVPILGLFFLVAAAFDTGKGEQIAPVMSVFVGAMFGVPTIAVLVRHVRNVWNKTRPESAV